MIYGNAEMMGVPWETIIKIYRAQLGEGHFRQLKEYADGFIGFLNENVDLFGQETQGEYFDGISFLYLDALKKELLGHIERHIQQQGAIEDSESQEFLEEIITRELERLCGREPLPIQMPSDFVERHKDKIVEIVDYVFEKLPLNPGTTERLIELISCLFSHDWFLLGTTGIVISGFGAQDVFPSLYEYEIECIIDDRLRYAPRRSAVINTEQSAVLFAFAQTEMVNTFMEGAEPSYRLFSEGYLDEVFKRYPLIIAEQVCPLVNKAQAETLRDTLRQTSRTLFEQYSKDMVEYRQKQYTDPIINTVASLPKDELASMAEALVNLTSVKHRFSKDVETVGGPIDVAVISKGDGFIWMQRKHYFRAELNHPFFANYFREIEDETGQEGKFNAKAAEE